jgi:hypothetical protein
MSCIAPYSSLPRAVTKSSVLFPLQNNRERHEPEHSCLQPGVFAQENGHVTDKRHIAQHTSNNILLAVEEALATRVKLGVVCGVVVALGQELQRSASVQSDIISNPPQNLISV